MTSRHISRKPRHDGAFEWPGAELNHRHEDFQSANVVPKMGTHVHQTTSNDVLTRLHSDELCR